MKLRTLDLFSGIGGFSLGLERTGGFETVAFCEIEPFPRAVLRKHWPDVPIHEDIRELTANDLGPVDVICGGFPCQDISEAGKRSGIDGKQSGLWADYARIIGDVRPRYVIVENVADLLGRGFERVLGDLATLGFDAWWSCLRACDIGAPHIRDRVWIVAYPEGCEAGCATARNCHKKFATTRAYQSPQTRGCFGDFGGKDWNPEPRICRVDDGVSPNVDRVGALGNAVVPQVVEQIGHAILGAEA